MQGSGKVVKVQKIPQREPKADDALSLLAELCYYYPAYTLKQARRLPYPHVQTLLRKARQLRAYHYYQLTQIAAAPHTEKGKGVSDLQKRFADEMNGQ